MGLADVISQEMTNEQLVVRHEIEDFNTKSQLIVYESQEAIFFKNGQALDLFGPGKHSLSTDNIPVIRKIFEGIFNKQTPFPCMVYFINKVNVLDMLWGTPVPIDVEDPKYHILVGVRANGQTGVRVRDSRRFLTKVVGQLNEYTVAEVKNAIKGRLMTVAKECIATTIVEKGVSILEITPKLSEISQAIQEKINDSVMDLGLSVEHFTVNTITAGPDDLTALRKAKTQMMQGINEVEMEAYKLERLSEARAKARANEGYTYQDERRFDVLGTAAQNEGAAGAFVGMGVGMGVGAGISREMQNVGAAMNSAPAQAPNAGAGVAATKFCTDCGASVPAGAKFCPGCGKPQTPPARFCPQCGATCDPNSKFCMTCGCKLG